MDELASRVNQAVPGTALVVGLSGGADSTLALLVGCAARTLFGCALSAVHCIHGLDADDPLWLAHCQELCRKLKVPLTTPKLHIVYGNGVSPEDASRQERYRALLSAAQGAALLLGHQADDQTENVLLMLKRGAGPGGLSGMREVTHDARGIILRPLLGLDKAQIEEILQALGYSFVYDISNSYLKFERNFIRLKVLPLLRERFPGIDGSLRRSARLCAFEHELALRQARAAAAQCVDFTKRTLSLTTAPLDDEPLMLMLLKLYLEEAGQDTVSYNTLQAAFILCRGSADQHTSLKIGSLFLRRFKNRLYLVAGYLPPPPGRYRLQAGESLTLGGLRYTLVAVKAAEGSGVAPGTLELCFYTDLPEVLLWFGAPGSLKLHPQTRVHARELKKLFGEYDIPWWERAKQCVIEDTHSGEALALGQSFVTKKGREPRQWALRLEIHPK